MKELLTGDAVYKAKGLIKVIAWIKPAVRRRYLRAAKKKDWSVTKYYSWAITKKAPK